MTREQLDAMAKSLEFNGRRLKKTADDLLDAGFGDQGIAIQQVQLLVQSLGAAIEAAAKAAPKPAKPRRRPYRRL